ncbi:alpha-1,6-mannosyl-glycoprotein 2-beta-N-acetylglucosaminyltransferase isoform X2 [Drosophila sulfurigaster albostrigata]|uniref:Alpha-1,6-mannosyl-glycoprotein 2-beta-N-acetylglucosaminyltransferase n=1 Tax=Drosophila albomicans TaxID=7291 RepID=A0A6P8XIQ2_DROAB|nr:alpha-1,6-mannosyl-glycoprotein 2-beta-N-acetylglucosaminyltransferase isoform X2 [Drosophila albomicans]XP_062121645.1 alpha-1,6-mannosyl-glycoprotein 2-beta-N-acetylglucosaminyltransferase isoform X2 [Drosophila sulfurigaster albostrigata]
MSKMRGRVLIPLPNTGAMGRKRNNFYMRSIFILALCIFGLLQYHNFNYLDSRDAMMGDSVTNDSVDAILSMVPATLHKYLTPHSRNHSTSAAALALNASNSAGSGTAGLSAATTISFDPYRPPNITEIKRQIIRYNEMQLVLNEDTFGPLQNDSVIIVIQVHTRINYLRHLIVSLAQARDISKTLLIFSHDYYDDDINDLVQQIDFCKVLQIFYPHSIQTHPHEYPGVDPNDCPRNIKKEQALITNCNNALYPDLYGHYREAKFTQTKHHWWWKANRVFNELEVTRFHTGLVLFLEEDHYVAEDFLYLLAMMQQRTKDLCPQCNILSLGTYLKTFNYYTYHSKVEAMPWISSKHNMGFAFNRTTWRSIRRCAQHFCSYDDYNWDWSLQHVSQQCLQRKLHAMIVKGPRVFHIGECGVHHKNKNCESNQVISKVQHVLRIARNSHQLFPRSIMMTVPSLLKKSKLRKGNGGWGDLRDHELCMNMTLPTR